MADLSKLPLYGVLPINKPADHTSFDCIKIARKKLDFRKIGHSGTLDPFAEGLLVLLIGETVKLQTQFMKSRKTYIGTVRLGQETDSGDKTGEVIKTADDDRITELNLTKIKEIISYKFKGEIEQVPPSHSAIHVNGVKSYKLAHRGKHVELPSRKVTIYDFTVSELKGNRLDFEISCSTGTYIRSIARDLGRELEVFGHLEALRRTASGNITLENAVSLDDISRSSLIPFEKFITPPQDRILLTSEEDFKRIELGKMEKWDSPGAAKGGLSWFYYQDIPVLIRDSRSRKNIYNVIKLLKR